MSAAPESSAAPRPSSRRGELLLGVAAIVLMAATMRLPVAALSPLAGRIDADIPLSALALGALGTAPPLAFALAGLTGLVSSFFLARAPEPRMRDAGPMAGLAQRLRAPLQDANFRHLLVFMGSWTAASNPAWSPLLQ